MRASTPKASAHSEKGGLSKPLPMKTPPRKSSECSVVSDAVRDNQQNSGSRRVSESQRQKSAPGLQDRPPVSAPSARAQKAPMRAEGARAAGQTTQGLGTEPKATPEPRTPKVGSLRKGGTLTQKEPLRANTRVFQEPQPPPAHEQRLPKVAPHPKGGARTKKSSLSREDQVDTQTDTPEVLEPPAAPEPPPPIAGKRGKGAHHAKRKPLNSEKKPRSQTQTPEEGGKPQPIPRAPHLLTGLKPKLGTRIKKAPLSAEAYLDLQAGLVEGLDTPAAPQPPLRKAAPVRPGGSHRKKPLSAEALPAAATQTPFPVAGSRLKGVEGTKKAPPTHSNQLHRLIDQIEGAKPDATPQTLLPEAVSASKRSVGTEKASLTTEVAVDEKTVVRQEPVPPAHPQPPLLNAAPLSQGGEGIKKRKPLSAEGTADKDPLPPAVPEPPLPVHGSLPKGRKGTKTAPPSAEPVLGLPAGLIERLDTPAVPQPPLHKVAPLSQRGAGVKKKKPLRAVGTADKEPVPPAAPEPPLPVHGSLPTGGAGTKLAPASVDDHLRRLFDQLEEVKHHATPQPRLPGAVSGSKSGVGTQKASLTTEDAVDGQSVLRQEPVPPAQPQSRVSKAAPISQGGAGAKKKKPLSAADRVLEEPEPSSPSAPPPSAARSGHQGGARAKTAPPTADPVQGLPTGLIEGLETAAAPQPPLSKAAPLSQGKAGTQRKRPLSAEGTADKEPVPPAAPLPPLLVAGSRPKGIIRSIKAPLSAQLGSDLQAGLVEGLDTPAVPQPPLHKVAPLSQRGAGVKKKKPLRAEGTADKEPVPPAVPEPPLPVHGSLPTGGAGTKLAPASVDDHLRRLFDQLEEVKHHATPQPRLPGAVSGSKGGVGTQKASLTTEDAVDGQSVLRQEPVPPAQPQSRVSKAAPLSQGGAGAKKKKPLSTAGRVLEEPEPSSPWAPPPSAARSGHQGGARAKTAPPTAGPDQGLPAGLIERLETPAAPQPLLSKADPLRQGKAGTQRKRPLSAVGTADKEPVPPVVPEPPLPVHGSLPTGGAGTKLAPASVDDHLRRLFDQLEEVKHHATPQPRLPGAVSGSKGGVGTQKASLTTEDAVDGQSVLRQEPVPPAQPQSRVSKAAPLSQGGAGAKKKKKPLSAADRVLEEPEPSSPSAPPPSAARSGHQGGARAKTAPPTADPVQGLPAGLIEGLETAAAPQPPLSKAAPLSQGKAGVKRKRPLSAEGTADKEPVPPAAPLPPLLVAGSRPKGIIRSIKAPLSAQLGSDLQAGLVEGLDTPAVPQPPLHKVAPLSQRGAGVKKKKPLRAEGTADKEPVPPAVPEPPLPVHGSLPTGGAGTKLAPASVDDHLRRLFDQLEEVKHHATSQPRLRGAVSDSKGGVGTRKASLTTEDAVDGQSVLRQEPVPPAQPQSRVSKAAPISQGGAGAKKKKPLSAADRVLEEPEPSSPSAPPPSAARSGHQGGARAKTAPPTADPVQGLPTGLIEGLETAAAPQPPLSKAAPLSQGKAGTQRKRPLSAEGTADKEPVPPAAPLPPLLVAGSRPKGIIRSIKAPLSAQLGSDLQAGLVEGLDTPAVPQPPLHKVAPLSQRGAGVKKKKPLRAEGTADKEPVPPAVPEPPLPVHGSLPTGGAGTKLAPASVDDHLRRLFDQLEEVKHHATPQPRLPGAVSGSKGGVGTQKASLTTEDAVDGQSVLRQEPVPPAQPQSRVSKAAPLSQGGAGAKKKKPLSTAGRVLEEPEPSSPWAPPPSAARSGHQGGARAKTAPPTAGPDQGLPAGLIERLETPAAPQPLLSKADPLRQGKAGTQRKRPLSAVGTADKEPVPPVVPEPPLPVHGSLPTGGAGTKLAPASVDDHLRRLFDQLEEVKHHATPQPRLPGAVSGSKGGVGTQKASLTTEDAVDGQSVLRQEPVPPAQPQSRVSKAAPLSQGGAGAKKKKKPLSAADRVLEEPEPSSPSAPPPSAARSGHQGGARAKTAPPTADPVQGLPAGLIEGLETAAAPQPPLSKAAPLSQGKAGVKRKRPLSAEGTADKEPVPPAAPLPPLLVAGSRPKGIIRSIKAPLSAQLGSDLQAGLVEGLDTPAVPQPPLHKVAPLSQRGAGVKKKKPLRAEGTADKEPVPPAVPEPPLPVHGSLPTGGAGTKLAPASVDDHLRRLFDQLEEVKHHATSQPRLRGAVSDSKGGVGTRKASLTTEDAVDGQSVLRQEPVPPAQPQSRVSKAAPLSQGGAGAKKKKKPLSAADRVLEEPEPSSPSAPPPSAARSGHQGGARAKTAPPTADPVQGLPAGLIEGLETAAAPQPPLSKAAPLSQGKAGVKRKRPLSAEGTADKEPVPPAAPLPPLLVAGSRPKGIIRSIKAPLSAQLGSDLQAGLVEGLDTPAVPQPPLHKVAPLSQRGAGVKKKKPLRAEGTADKEPVPPAVPEPPLPVHGSLPTGGAGTKLAPASVDDHLRRLFDQLEEVKHHATSQPRLRGAVSDSKGGVGTRKASLTTEDAVDGQSVLRQEPVPPAQPQSRVSKAAPLSQGGAGGKKKKPLSTAGRVLEEPEPSSPWAPPPSAARSGHQGGARAKTAPPTAGPDQGLPAGLIERLETPAAPQPLLSKADPLRQGKAGTQRKRPLSAVGTADKEPVPPVVPEPPLPVHGSLPTGGAGTKLAPASVDDHLRRLFDQLEEVKHHATPQPRLPGAVSGSKGGVGTQKASLTTEDAVDGQSVLRQEPVPPAQLQSRVSKAAPLSQGGAGAKKKKKPLSAADRVLEEPEPSSTSAPPPSAARSGHQGGARAKTAPPTADPVQGLPAGLIEGLETAAAPQPPLSKAAPLSQGKAGVKRKRPLSAEGTADKEPVPPAAPLPPLLVAGSRPKGIIRSIKAPLSAQLGSDLQAGLVEGLDTPAVPQPPLHKVAPLSQRGAGVKKKKPLRAEGTADKEPVPPAVPEPPLPVHGSLPTGGAGTKLAPASVDDHLRRLFDQLEEVKHHATSQPRLRGAVSDSKGGVGTRKASLTTEDAVDGQSVLRQEPVPPAQPQSRVSKAAPLSQGGAGAKKKKKPLSAADRVLEEPEPSSPSAPPPSAARSGHQGGARAKTAPPTADPVQGLPAGLIEGLETAAAPQPPLSKAAPLSQGKAGVKRKRPLSAEGTADKEPVPPAAPLPPLLVAGSRPKGIIRSIKAPLSAQLGSDLQAGLVEGLDTPAVPQPPLHKVAPLSQRGAGVKKKKPLRAEGTADKEPVPPAVPEPPLPVHGSLPTGGAGTKLAPASVDDHLRRLFDQLEEVKHHATSQPRLRGAVSDSKGGVGTRKASLTTEDAVDGQSVLRQEPVPPAQPQSRVSKAAPLSQGGAGGKKKKPLSAAGRVLEEPEPSSPWAPPPSAATSGHQGGARAKRAPLTADPVQGLPAGLIERLETPSAPQPLLSKADPLRQGKAGTQRKRPLSAVGTADKEPVPPVVPEPPLPVLGSLPTGGAGTKLAPASVDDHLRRLFDQLEEVKHHATPQPRLLGAVSGSKGGVGTQKASLTTEDVVDGQRVMRKEPVPPAQPQSRVSKAAPLSQGGAGAKKKKPLSAAGRVLEEPEPSSPWAPPPSAATSGHQGGARAKRAPPTADPVQGLPAGLIERLETPSAPQPLLSKADPLRQGKAGTQRKRPLSAVGTADKEPVPPAAPEPPLPVHGSLPTGGAGTKLAPASVDDHLRRLFDQLEEVKHHATPQPRLPGAVSGSKSGVGTQKASLTTEDAVDGQSVLRQEPVPPAQPQSRVSKAAPLSQGGAGAKKKKPLRAAGPVLEEPEPSSPWAPRLFAARSGHQGGARAKTAPPTADPVQGLPAGLIEGLETAAAPQPPLSKAAPLSQGKAGVKRKRPLSAEGTADKEPVPPAAPLPPLLVAGSRPKGIIRSIKAPLSAQLGSDLQAGLVEGLDTPAVPQPPLHKVAPLSQRGAGVKKKKPLRAEGTADKEPVPPAVPEPPLPVHGSLPTGGAGTKLAPASVDDHLRRLFDQLEEVKHHATPQPRLPGAVSGSKGGVGTQKASLTTEDAVDGQSVLRQEPVPPAQPQSRVSKAAPLSQGGAGAKKKKPLSTAGRVLEEPEPSSPWAPPPSAARSGHQGGARAKTAPPTAGPDQGLPAGLIERLETPAAPQPLLSKADPLRQGKAGTQRKRPLSAVGTADKEPVPPVVREPPLPVHGSLPTGGAGTKLAPASVDDHLRRLFDQLEEVKHHATPQPRLPGAVSGSKGGVGTQKASLTTEDAVDGQSVLRQEPVPPAQLQSRVSKAAPLSQGGAGAKKKKPLSAAGPVLEEPESSSPSAPPPSAARSGHQGGARAKTAPGTVDPVLGLPAGLNEGLETAAAPQPPLRKVAPRRLGGAGVKMRKPHETSQRPLCPEGALDISAGVPQGLEPSTDQLPLLPSAGGHREGGVRSNKAPLRTEDTGDSLAEVVVGPAPLAAPQPLFPRVGTCSGTVVRCAQEQRPRSNPTKVRAPRLGHKAAAPGRWKPRAVLQKLRLSRREISVAAEVVNKIVDQLLRRLQSWQSQFKGVSLLNTGSYYEQVKVSAPNEFDVMLPLDIPRIQLEEYNNSGAHYFVKFKRNPRENPLNEFLEEEKLSASKMLSKFRKIIQEEVKNIADVSVEKMKRGCPAVTLLISKPEKISVDIILALKVKKNWPDSTKEGLSIKNWLGAKVKRNLRRQPFYLVPKFAKEGNRFQGKTWRLSFSHIEKNILENHGKAKTCCEYDGVKCCRKDCLKLMKYLLEQLKGKFENSKEVNKFCSYHMKTAFFHLCVENPEDSDWQSKDLELCFDRCVQYFLQCLEKECLEHFFIPGVNLFSRDKINRKSKKFMLKEIECERNNGYPIFVAF